MKKIPFQLVTQSQLSDEGTELFIKFLWFELFIGN